MLRCLVCMFRNTAVPINQFSDCQVGEITFRNFYTWAVGVHVLRSSSGSGSSGGVGTGAGSVIRCTALEQVIKAVF